jgi:hypothetical protein
MVIPGSKGCNILSASRDCGGTYMPQRKLGALSTRDIAEIQQLNSRYSIAIDNLIASSADAWAETFTSNGSFTLCDATGKVELHAVGTRDLKALHDRFPNPANTRHWFNNLLIEHDGAGARMTCYLISLLTKSDSMHPAAIARTGVYRDKLLKTKGGWKFSAREVTLDTASSG